MRILDNLKLPWLPLIAVGTIIEAYFFLSFGSTQALNQHPLLFVIVVPFCIAAPVGGWWAVYQCIRHEVHPIRFIVIVLVVPLGFTWYYFERYLPRTAAGWPRSPHSK